MSRPAVREALKRLSAVGLVEVRQGDSTTVRDFRRHAGLDLLPRLLLRAGELDLTSREAFSRLACTMDRRSQSWRPNVGKPELAAQLDDSVRRLESEHDPSNSSAGH